MKILYFDAHCDTLSRMAYLPGAHLERRTGQWDLEKLSPREYYCYRQTGVYPLKPGISKKRNSQGSAPVPEV